MSMVMAVFMMMGTVAMVVVGVVALCRGCLQRPGSRLHLEMGPRSDEWPQFEAILFLLLALDRLLLKEEPSALGGSTGLG